MTLLWKELRDVVKWTPVGVILIGVLCWLAIPRGVSSAGQTETDLVTSVGIACGVVALALGWLQSFSDFRTDARGFLLHRPITPAKIFWAKSGAGFAAYAICVVPPLLVAALILQSQGMHLLPSSGWQVWPLAVASPIIFAMHPAAMWTACRGARWIGTKCMRVTDRSWRKGNRCWRSPRFPFPSNARWR
jgi:hypothetical protein